MKQLPVFLFLLITFQLNAQTYNTLGQLVASQTPITAVPFLRISPDVAASGMADIGIATESTAAGICLNPAKMNFSKKKIDFSLTYSPWLAALKIPINYTFIGGFYKFNEKHTIGIHARALMGKNIIDGPIPINDKALGMSYCYRIARHFSIGTTISWLRSNSYFGSILGDTIIHKALFADIGLYYQTKQKIAQTELTYSAGIALTNIGKSIIYDRGPIITPSYPYPLPTNLGIGAALRIHTANHFLINPAIEINHLLVSTRGTTFSIGSELGRIIPIKKNNLKIVGRVGYFGESREKGDRQLITTGLGAEIILYKLSFGTALSYWFPLIQNHPLQNTIKMGFNMGYLF